VKERLHLTRERNPQIVRQAKALAMQRQGRLQCACCEFEFESVYGRVGVGFIEAHHTKPLSTLHEDGEETQVEDIVLVCSNCHRMLHRRRPWLGVHDLKCLISGPSAAGRLKV
jgi:predicted HNH restriction endonuclease